jgi:hypothetical protein
LPDSIILEKIPVILGKISSLKGVKLTEEYKYIYNYLGWLYSKRFDEYEAKETVDIYNFLEMTPKILEGVLIKFDEED